VRSSNRIYTFKLDGSPNIITDKVLIENAPLLQLLPSRQEYGKVQTVKIECFVENADEMEIIVNKHITDAQ
jgi:hypothetical protein